MEADLSLNALKPGQFAVIKGLAHSCGMRRRLLDMGLVENTHIQCVGKSPLGDPKAFLIRGTVIAIRSEECSNIAVRNIQDM